jgi:hypothetical protein
MNELKRVMKTGNFNFDNYTYIYPIGGGQSGPPKVAITSPTFNYEQNKNKNRTS